jgi:hypothetical protein
VHGGGQTGFKIGGRQGAGREADRVQGGAYRVQVEADSRQGGEQTEYRVMIRQNSSRQNES